ARPADLQDRAGSDPSHCGDLPGQLRDALAADGARERGEGAGIARARPQHSQWRIMDQRAHAHSKYGFERKAWEVSRGFCPRSREEWGLTSRATKGFSPGSRNP